MTAVLIVVIAVVLIGAISGVLVINRRSPKGLDAGRTTPPSTLGTEARQAPVAVAAQPTPAEVLDPSTPVVVVSEPEPEIAVDAPNLRDRLGKTRGLFAASIGRLRGQPKVDVAAFDALEEALLLADVGLPTTTRLLDALREGVRTGAIEATIDALIAALGDEIVGLFADEDRTLHFGERSPSVWLFVGVNGVGKTTTIGKVAAQQVAAGKSVVLAAGDTFRAAAGDQLSAWAERSGAGIIRGADGADPSSVVFDAVAHASARAADLVLGDTAGRLHTKVNLMEELKKVRRIADRPPGEVAEVLLVLDATTGQNGLSQAREFTDAVDLTGVVLTKLDGSAKGGVVLAIRSELGLPIKLVGVGEQVGDLIAFDPQEFAHALLS